jgi:hypothetical protein
MRNKIKTRKKAVTCYDHLGGRLGELLFKLLIDKKWLTKDANSRSYHITDAGWKCFEELGIDTAKLKLSSRVPVSPCVERFSGQFYEHTGAHLGALLTARLVTLGWLIPKPEKEYEITEIGRQGLTDLGLILDHLEKPL